MQNLSGRRVVILLLLAAVITSGLVFASINPAETSPVCMPDYIKKHGRDECLETAASSEASLKVIETGR